MNPTSAVTSNSPQADAGSSDTSALGGNGFVRNTLLITGRHISASRRDPGSAYIAPTVIPLAIIAIVSQIFGITAALPGFPTADLVDWMMPGMVVMTGMFGGGATAIRVVRDVRSGYLDRLRLLPVTSGSVLAGAVLFDALRTIPPALAVLAVGVLLGAPVESGVVAVVVLVAVAMLWATTWNSVFLTVGLRTHSEQAVLALVPLFLPLWWMSSVLISDNLMPSWISQVSAVNPISMLVDGVRPLAIGGPVDSDRLVAGLTVSVVLLFVLQFVAARSYRRLGDR
jgi:ABC-2 type transport system permease protein